MKARRHLGRIAVIGLISISLAGCVGYGPQSRKTNNTLLGAGLGGAAGAVVSGGDPLTTIGGAAAGGLLGNILTDDRRGGSRGGRYYRGDRY